MTDAAWIGMVMAGVWTLAIGLLPAGDDRDTVRRARRWLVSPRVSEEADRPRRGLLGLLGRSGWTGSSRTAGETAADTGAALALLVAEVAARLRAGASVPEAWRAAWARTPGLGPWTSVDPDGAPAEVVRLARRPRWRDMVARAGSGEEGPRRPGIVEVLRAGGARARSGRRAAAALAAACRFTHLLGAPLAGVLDVVADGIDESAAAEDARRIARSGPATSARVLTALPLVGVAAGEALGAHPLERFADGGIGTVCLVVGVVCLAAGHLTSRRMLRRVEDRGSAAGMDPAILCDLVVAGLESGASVPATLEALGRAGGLPDLARIGRELVLGVPWRLAWDPCPAPTVLVAQSLEPAWEDGTSPVPLLRRVAAQLRARRISDARAEAEALGVRLVVPLGALLLPAFLALGVVPVLLHLGTGGFSGLG